jgi:stress-induced morphogen
MIHPSEIEKILKEKFSDSQIAVEDLTGTQDHFQVTLVSRDFEGLSMIEQHQKVYGALQEQMKEAIHALTLKTYTPEAWEKAKPNQAGPKGIH